RESSFDVGTTMGSIMKTLSGGALSEKAPPLKYCISKAHPVDEQAKPTLPYPALRSESYSARIGFPQSCQVLAWKASMRSPCPPSKTLDTRPFPPPEAVSA